MPFPSVPIFLVPAEALTAFAGATTGKLTKHMTRSEEDMPFALLDTFDETLRQSGMCLLQAGGELTLWTADGEVLTQTGVDQPAGFVADLAEGPVKLALACVPELRSLIPLAQGRLQTAQLALLDKEGKTQARARFHILTPDLGHRIAIAQLQGLRGYDKAFAQLQADLLGAGAVPYADRHPLIALLPEHAPYVAKPDLELEADATVFDTANAIIAAYLPVARQNEQGVVDDIDVEFLHDYRIALRKIRSVVSLFKGVYSDKQTERLKQRFSDLMAPTGRLRDLDVYLLERDFFFDLVPQSLHGGLERMFDMFAAERTVAHQKLAKHLKSKGYATEITKLVSLFEAPKRLHRGPDADSQAHDFASALIWKRYRKICKIAEAIDDQTEDEEVHELRIHCKKLRYLMEFFAPAFPAEEFKSLIKPLKKLQDNLGLFNDYSVQQDSLRAFLDGLGTDDHAGNMQLAQSVGALIAVLHQRQLGERQKVVESFQSFNSPETQQTFRDLFHGGEG
ncbi:CHAD domain-containing protein [Donghicola mangrovi]|uniref:CHAD domain-containing protein n=1 Tax=Donghicola mangrovi TaxID=2729614 RepID=A0A850QAH1_9RHOB|nr:CHAD domain-containing protein [Donghicola mangrovi]NVO25302.1 CHAD domain-containing protein [Donghicola mangrovi]